MSGDIYMCSQPAGIACDLELQGGKVTSMSLATVHLQEAPSLCSTQTLRIFLPNLLARNTRKQPLQFKLFKAGPMVPEATFLNRALLAF